MKKVLLAILIIFAGVVFVSTVNAQNREATDSRKSEAAKRARERIELLKDRRASKAAELRDKRDKIRDKVRRRAHVSGEITAISGTSITIETRKGDVKTIFTDDETKFIQFGQGGKKEIKLADFKIGDRVAAVGIAKDEDSGLAKYLVRFVRPEIRRHAVFGVVDEIGEDELKVLHIIHQDRPATTVKVTNDTLIKFKGKEGAKFSDIKVDDKVAASGTVDEKGVITARRIFVIPGNFTEATPKNSTNSATPSSSTE
ncbi:MAG: DUF5666 domain-containing protein [Candidatus Woykebacteria bacterium]